MGRSPTDVKEKLIETAIDLIWCSSYGSVSVEDICKAAGAQKGSFYYYFESKADLALAALEVQFERTRPEYEATFAPGMGPLERLERLVDHVYAKQKKSLETYGRVCGCPFVTLGSEVVGQEEQLNARIDEILVGYISGLKEMIEEGMVAGLIPKDMDADQKALEVHSYLIGQMTMARVKNSLEIMDTLKDGIFSILGIKDETLKAAKIKQLEHI